MMKANVIKSQSLWSEQANTKMTGIYTEYSIAHHVDFFRTYIKHRKIYCYGLQLWKYNCGCCVCCSKAVPHSFCNENGKIT